MKIGLIKEIKKDEKRVALLPDKVSKLVELNHEVFFTPTIAEFIGIDDDEYIKAGAISKPSEYIWKNADIIVKVKTPEQNEPKLIREGQIIYSYLHFDENLPAEKSKELVDTGGIFIAWEWIFENNDYPLLTPMSEITGSIAAFKTMEFLMKYKGHLVGNFFKGVSPACAMVIGIGNIGRNAAGVYMRNGLDLIIVDKNPDTLRSRLLRVVSKEIINEYLKTKKLSIIPFDEENPYNAIQEITQKMSQVDILLLSALRRESLPKSKLEYMITTEMVKKMEENGIICDGTACNYDLIETSESSVELDRIYKRDGVWHWSPDHIPSICAKTASEILSEKIFPYLLQITEDGIKKTLKENNAIRNGVLAFNRKFCHKRTCDIKNHPYYPIDEILKEI